MAFTIDANLPEITLQFDQLRAEQVPFAESLAINWTLKGAQGDVRRALPTQFTLRSTWVEKGVQVKPSNKTTREGSLEQRDPFMARQEFGGTKYPAARALAIPTKALRNEYARGKIPKSARPGALMKRNNVYIGKTEKGRATIYRRGRTKATPPKPLYFLVPRGEVKPRFRFEDRATRHVREHYEKNFGKALARALSTSRKR